MSFDSANFLRITSTCARSDVSSSSIWFTLPSRAAAILRMSPEVHRLSATFALTPSRNTDAHVRLCIGASACSGHRAMLGTSYSTTL